MCSLTVMASMLNPVSIRGIVDQMDALNTALYWAVRKSKKDIEKVNVSISKERYEHCVSLLQVFIVK